MAQAPIKPKLLIVDDNQRMLRSWQRSLSSEFDILLARSVQEARDAIKVNPDLALLDIRLDDDDAKNRDGVQLLKEFLAKSPHLPIVMISALHDIKVAVECMQLGAVDFVEKEVSNLELRQRLRNALKSSEDKRKVRLLEEYLAKKEPVTIIGESPPIRELKNQIQMVARDGQICVLIRGETGTGKELVAKAIHKSGKRAGKPFVAVSINALSEKLVESELFGHERFAFTDAKTRQIGWIEEAKDGVLFLDEIGDLPMDAQVKLLRFLQDHRFSRVGGRESISVDIQIVSATHQNLEKLIAEGKFREDLYYRIKGFQIEIPPLRHRKDDIPLLVSFILQKLKTDGRTKIMTASDDALSILSRYNWPGNVRELENILERAVIVAQNLGHSQIQAQDLPGDLNQEKPFLQHTVESDIAERFDLAKNVARVQLSCIEEALKAVGGRKTEAWKKLGLHDRYALHRLMKRLKQEHPRLFNEFPYLKKVYSNM